MTASEEVNIPVEPRSMGAIDRWSTSVTCVAALGRISRTFLTRDGGKHFVIDTSRNGNDRHGGQEPLPFWPPSRVV